MIEFIIADRTQNKDRTTKREVADDKGAGSHICDNEHDCEKEQHHKKCFLVFHQFEIFYQ